MSDEGCEQSGQQDSGEVEITETTSPVSVIWIWSISIPSERARSAASFIIPFLDCISHTEEISSYEGISHGMSSSPPLSSSIPKSGHEPYLPVLANLFVKRQRSIGT